MSTNFNDILVRWRTRVGYEFPERYQSYINRGDYLAAFLLACNLVEFYLIQYLFELSFDFELRKEVTLATRLQRLLRFLPPPLAERLIMLFIRLRRPAIERKPTDYVSEGWTLGRLIEEAKSYGADKDLIKRLYAFNGQRKLILHNMLWKEHLSRNVDDEAKKSCDKANKVWEEFRKHLDWLGPFQESKKDS